MDYDEKHDELESSSSLRTQLIEAQILDSRLEGKESDTHGSSSHHNESLELIASDYTINISDNTVNENSVALKEIDDTIVRLQEWHLKREFNKKEREEDMLKSIDFEKEQAIEADLDISLNENNEDDIEGISRNVKRDRAKASLATVEALLQRKYLPNHIVDLSRLADQDLLMKKNLMILEEEDQEYYDAYFRQTAEKVRKSIDQETIQREEITTSGTILESDVRSLEDQLLLFSTVLDSLILQTESPDTPPPIPQARNPEN